MNKLQVGILDYGIYLPQPRMTAGEIAAATKGHWTEENIIDKLGIVEKTMPGKQDGTQEMGALAALNLLERCQLDPKEIDVILCFGEEWKEYPLTTSALYIQDRIGAVNAWGIDVQNRCCTTVSAIKIAKDMLIADASINYILLAGGYRNCDYVSYEDPQMSMMFNLSAGGGALLLKRNHDQNIVLGSSIIGDGSLARTVGVEIGGQARPVDGNNWQEAATSLRLMDAEKMKNRLRAVSHQNWMKCIQTASNKSGFEVSDIDYLNILHIKRSAHLAILADLGLKEDQTVYLENYGHMGQVDQILSLALGLEAGRIKKGTVMCMLAAGIGYVWAANIIRWG